MLRLACVLLVSLALILPGAGCGGGNAQLVNDLKQVGLAYHNYHDTYKKGPPNWDEFLAFAQQTGEPVESLQRVRDAGYEMQWDVELKNVREGLSSTVMARPPGGAGPALMFDGSVRE